MKRLILVTALFALLGTALPGLAAGLIIVHDSEFWPGPIPPPQPIPPRPIPPWPHPPRPIPPPRVYPFAPLEMTYAKVNARVTDQIAVTSVDQEFFNPNPQRLEGTFIFPVPKGAQINKFTMEIDGKQVEAELLSAEKAKRIYEDIVRKMKDPALLEYSGRDLFKVRIFPIEPHSRKRITLSYSQLLKSDNGLVDYVLPLNTEKYSAKPIKKVSVKLELETKRPLKSIYSPSHTVEIKRDGATRAVVGYEASDVKPDADFQLYYSTEKGEIAANLLTYKTGGEDGYFVLLVSPGIDVKEKQVVLKDVAFVLDTSGSMAGKKLDQAKKALQFCVENLNDGDRFEIIRFSTEVEPLFDKFVDASKANRSKANDFIKELKPIGGTAIDDALRKALALKSEVRSPKSDNDRPFVVIFLTDGRPTIGTTDEEQIVAGVRKNSGNTRIFCFGIGTDVNTHLLDKITEETRAFSQYVLPEEDIEVKVSNFFSKIKEPVLANPKLHFTGDIRATKIYPAPLPDIFKGEQLVVVGRYSGKGDSAVVIQGTINGARRKLTYEVKFPSESSDHEFIPRLWATRRVGYLLDEIRLHGENSELRDEVTDLARKYGIVTPYTAYLILEDEKQRNVPLSTQSLPQLNTDGVANRLVDEAYRKFNSDKSGDSAVAASRYGLALKSANASAEALAEGRIESSRALGVPPRPLTSSAVAAGPASAAERVVQYSQQTQFAGGKNFFQNGNQWLDSLVQKVPNAKKVRIQFNSPEYFELTTKNSKALPWLALGQNVQFVLENTVYEIYE
ncbi:MAG: VWA domain-containing protein [Verrucomicrobia bacterium]|nr:VWA domain-containing protein [Verrucomicrobiota bacterium]